MASRCSACGASHLPMTALCPECWSEELEAISVVSEGALETYTVVHRGPTGFAVPYAIGWASFETEGVRVLAPIRVDDLERLACGLAVHLRNEARDVGSPIPVLEVAGR